MSSKCSGRIPMMTCRQRPPSGLAAGARLSSGSRTSPIGQFSLSPSTVAGRKFIAGEPMNPATNRLRRLVVELLGRADLLDDAAAHDRDPVAEGHRLGLVVGDVDRGRAEPLLQPGDRGAHLDPELGVEVGQRLVHQEHLGLRTMARPIATRWRWPPERWAGLRSSSSVSSRMSAASSTCSSISSCVGLRQLQREGHVLADRHVRVEGVVLEHHRDVAVLRATSGSTTSPSIRSSPSEMSSRPAIMLSTSTCRSPTGRPG